MSHNVLPLAVVTSADETTPDLSASDTLKSHLFPIFGDVEIIKTTTDTNEAWRAADRIQRLLDQIIY
jgi:hypothetical protein